MTLTLNLTLSFSFLMLGRYLGSFSVDFMQGVLSLLSCYEAVVVGYTCRKGKESLETFRRRFYQVFILQRLLPAPDYTVHNFKSMFYDCTSCGIRPRINLYSWKFIPQDVQTYPTVPPVSDKKCKECTTSNLYNWFRLEENRVRVLDSSMEKYDLGDYSYFSVSYWRTPNCIHLLDYGCTCCDNKLTVHDKVVRVLTNEEFYGCPTLYHMECFFNRFALWTFS